MNHTDAAEFLRAYAPAGTPLPVCLRLARTNATANQSRVEEAAKALGLGERVNTNEAPYPHELEELVNATTYRRGWEVTLRAMDRGQGSRGLTVSIVTDTVNSYPPHQRMRVQHLFPVPPAAYNRQSWQRWLFERFVEVELHECMEFFTVDGEKPYAPNHGPGFDPYVVRELTTDLDRRTSFRGEVNE